MKQCPNCQLPFEARKMDKGRHYPDEVMQELYRRQKTSDLCLDCLLEEWVAELGASILKQHQRDTAARRITDDSERPPPPPNFINRL